MTLVWVLGVYGTPAMERDKMGVSHSPQSESNAVGSVQMIWNRFMPHATAIPVLAYTNAEEAAAWLCHAFAFTIRLRVDTHRVQLNVGEGAVIVRELRPLEIGRPIGLGHSITVRIDDVDVHCKLARKHGAKITQEPATHGYGERKYVAEDLAAIPGRFHSQ